MKTLLASFAVLAVLAASAAHAGSLAPAPRVVAKYERDFIERSGAQTFEELLDTGIVRYMLTGGQPLLVLVNGPALRHHLQRSGFPAPLGHRAHRVPERR